MSYPMPSQATSTLDKSRTKRLSNPSKKVSPGKRPRRSLSLGTILLLSVISAILFAYGSAYMGVSRLQGQLADTKSEISKWTAKNSELKRQVRYMKSPEYVESIARKELGLVKEDEVVVVLK